MCTETKKPDMATRTNMKDDVAVVVCLDIVQPHDARVVERAIVSSRYSRVTLKLPDLLSGVRRFQHILQISILTFYIQHTHTV